MQQELDAMLPPVPIRLLGVNEAGQESGNATITEGRDLPWLQDTAEAKVWSSWGVTYRDLVVLDGDNLPIAVYNLTEHDLASPTSYQELRQLLIDASVAEANKP